MSSGGKEQGATGNREGMLQALGEMAAFCDGQLRMKEEDGVCGGEGGEGEGERERERESLYFFLSLADIDSSLDVSVS